MSRLLSEMLRKAQNLKPKFNEKLEELAGRHVEGVSGCVRVVASCDKHIVAIEIGHETEKLHEAGKLQEDILKASNDALKKANAVLKEEMGKLLGDLGLFFPGLI